MCELFQKLSSSSTFTPRNLFEFVRNVSFTRNESHHNSYFQPALQSMQYSTISLSILFFFVYRSFRPLIDLFYWIILLEARLRNADGKLNGADANGSASFSNEAWWSDGNGGGASLGGPFNDIDDDEVCDVGVTGDVRSTLPWNAFDTFRMGELMSPVLGAVRRW